MGKRESPSGKEAYFRCSSHESPHVLLSITVSKAKPGAWK